MASVAKVTLHGGSAVGDGMVLSVPRVAQGIVVGGCLYEPPPAPGPFYPDWFAVEWSTVDLRGEPREVPRR